MVTGLDEPATDWPRDHDLLASVATAGQSADEVSPVRFGPPVSPHHAAELAGTAIEPLDLARLARERGAKADALVCEGVGGLLVPLAPAYQVRDLAIELELPLVIAARPGLGTINHSLLTVEAARVAGLDVRAVVLTPWPESPGDLELSNMRTIEAIGRVAVAGLPETAPDARSLAGAAQRLPLTDWLAR
ncbi:MAG: dethiobiotin synthase [Actinobacteria bacterium]|nr:dethiobiotin synthase [Actinomycetota bacterium]